MGIKIADKRRFYSAVFAIFVIILFFVFAVVVMPIMIKAGHVEQTSQQVNKAPTPELGLYTILAYLDGGYKAITLYRDAGIVCVENVRWGKGTPAAGDSAAFSCWDVESAPKRIRELVQKYEQQRTTKSALDCGYAPCS